MVAAVVIAIGYVLGGMWLWIAAALVVVWSLPYAILKIFDIRDWVLHRLGK